MNRATLALMVLIGFLPLPAFAGDGATLLVGVWRFAGEIDTGADDSPIPAALANDSQGQLIYTADGFKSATIMPRGRRWNIVTATNNQLRESVADGTAYAGRYEVDAKTHTVTHIVLVSVEPGYEGQRLVRTFSLDGDTLELSGAYRYQGETHPLCQHVETRDR